MAFGFVPAFFLFAPTRYYYIMLLVPFLFFVSKLELRSRAAGLIMMFVTSMVARCLFFTGGGLSFPYSFTLSCLMLALALYMMLVASLNPPLKKEAGASSQT